MSSNQRLAVGLVLAIVISAAVSQSFDSDSLFPKSHPRPKQNWVNDPNGPFYLNGVYHLFTQYNPWSAAWTNLSWSHMVSYDLVFWIELPAPILPDMPYDVGGCWSGSATVLQDGRVALAYTGLDVNGTERQNLAFPKDPNDKFLQEWVKYEGNPVIPNPPPGGNVGGFRDDSTAWFQDGQYVMMVGSAVNGTGQAWLYTSSDFLNWTSQHSLFGDLSTGMFECPDFYPLQDFENPTSGTPFAFKASCGIDVYWIGSYDSNAVQFTPNGYVLGYQVLDHGRFYASKRFYDPVGKRQVLYGWSAELLANTSFMSWQGTITLPRQLGYNAEFNMMTQEPLLELQGLRAAVSHYSDSFSVGSNGYYNCSNHSWPSTQFEIVAQIDLTDACSMGCSAGFSVFTNPYGNQSTNFYISWNEPIGPLYNQTILNNYNQPLLSNVSLSSSHTRRHLMKECQALCSENSDCVTWTIEFNSSLSAAERENRPTGGRAQLLNAAWARPEHHHQAGSLDWLDQPAPNPWCFLFNLDPLNQSSIILIWGHGDSASGVDFNSPYPILVADNLLAGAGDISDFMAVIPVDPEQPKTTFELRAFVDHSVVEVFVDNLAVITSRVYPDASSDQWGFFVGSASQNVSVQLDAWQLLDAVA